MSKFPLLLFPLLLAGACAPRTEEPAYNPSPAPVRGDLAKDKRRPSDRDLTDAVKRGDVEQVRALLNQGANAKAQVDKVGGLLNALSGNDSGRDVSIAQLLVEHGAEVNRSGPPQGHSPLAAAIMGPADPLPMVRFLLAKGAKVDDPLPDGTTPLHLAVMRGRATTVRELLEHGANLEARTRSLHKVPTDAQVARSGLFKPLIRHSEPDPNSPGRTPVFHLVHHWNPEVFAVLREANANFKATDEEGWTVVHHAAFSGVERALQAFLKMGLDPNASAKGGNRPAHVATLSMLGFQSVKTVLQLEAGGADLQARNGKGQTPLEALRAKVDDLFTGEGARPMDDDQKHEILIRANEVAKALAPSAPPIVAPKPQIGALGTHYPNFDFRIFEAKRAVRVEGDRAILTLTIDKPPKSLMEFKIREIFLDNYETIEELPKVIDLRPGTPATITFAFPAAAAKVPLLNVNWSHSLPRGGTGGGSLSEGPGFAPMFRAQPDGRIEARNHTPGRTLALQLLSIEQSGKKSKRLSEPEVLLTTNEFCSLPGVTSAPGLDMTYRFRLLPNPTWTEYRIRFDDLSPATGAPLTPRTRITRPHDANDPKT